MSVWDQRVRAIHIAVRRNPDTVADVLAASDKVLREAGYAVFECEHGYVSDSLDVEGCPRWTLHSEEAKAKLLVPLDALAPEGSDDG